VKPGGAFSLPAIEESKAACAGAFLFTVAEDFSAGRLANTALPQAMIVAADSGATSFESFIMTNIRQAERGSTAAIDVPGCRTLPLLMMKCCG
jgi:hypothetical protein